MSCNAFRHNASSAAKPLVAHGIEGLLRDGRPWENGLAMGKVARYEAAPFGMSRGPPCDRTGPRLNSTSLAAGPALYRHPRISTRRIAARKADEVPVSDRRLEDPLVTPPYHPLASGDVLLHHSVKWSLDEADLAEPARSVYWHGAVAMAALDLLLGWGPCSGGEPGGLLALVLEDMVGSAQRAGPLLRGIKAELQAGRAGEVRLLGTFYPSMTEGLFRVVCGAIKTVRDTPFDNTRISDALPHWREIYEALSPPFLADQGALSLAVGGMLRELRRLPIVSQPAPTTRADGTGAQEFKRRGRVEDDPVVRREFLRVIKADGPIRLSAVANKAGQKANTARKILAALGKRDKLIRSTPDGYVITAKGESGL